MAVLEVRDQHYDSIFFDVKITATDQGPPKKEKLVTEAVDWVEERFEKKIEGGFLQVPVRHLVGTPLQLVTVEIDREEKLSAYLPDVFW